MAEFIYKGPAVETVAFGITFPKGEVVEVTDGYAIGKLTNNPCFVNGTSKKPEAAKGKTVQELLPIVATAAAEELDALAVGEERKMVTDAIAKRREALAQ